MRDNGTVPAPLDPVSEGITQERYVDVLGEPYFAETIELADDDEGPVVATLVSRESAVATGRAVLHLHGFADYFFQSNAADYWTERGYHFYALDLRKYGRSLRPHQTPNFTTDLASYYPEIDEAVRRIRERDGRTSLLLTAHSTGGLIAALWAGEQPRDLAGMILNSPWLNLQGNFLIRHAATRAIDQLGARRPYLTVPRNVSSIYNESLHRDFHGEWDFNLDWKPLTSWPVHAGWLRAIRRGHAKVHAGVDVGAPVLVLTSGSSAHPRVHDETVGVNDIVLDVEHIGRWAHRLGSHVTLVRIPGAVHDLTLSAEPARSAVFDQITRWVEAYVER